MQRGDIVNIMFPYSDGSGAKSRPAIIISGNLLSRYKDVVVLGITSKTLYNFVIEEPLNNTELVWGELPSDSFVRLFKIAFIDKSQIQEIIGTIRKDKLDIIFRKMVRLFQ